MKLGADVKAMILAAGRGERLRPLTNDFPKALLPVANTTLIAHVLQQLRDAGVCDVVINVCYLSQKIMDYCGDGSRFDVRIQYSVEKTLLNTGGGILKALPLLGEDPFLVMSADIWTDFPLHTLTQQKTHGAHLVLVDNPSFHPAGDFNLQGNRVMETSRDQRLTYANMAVLHPALFQAEKDAVFPLLTIFQKAMAAGIATGEYYRGMWHNIGTCQELHQLNMFLNQAPIS